MVSDSLSTAVWRNSAQILIQEKILSHKIIIPGLIIFKSVSEGWGLYNEKWSMVMGYINYE